MENKIKIAVDAMGGDNAPEEIVKGAVLALENKDISIILVGKENEIKKHLENLEYDKERIFIQNATEVITNEDVPTLAIRRKKDSSIVVGLKLVKENKCDGFVSAGNTGALLTGATVIVGRIKGIDRPALGTLFPTEKGFSFLIDAGANVDSKPNFLHQFAKMGSTYMETIMGISNPKVGLINIGVEEEKGNALTKEAFALLKEDKSINFYGNLEARDIPKGIVDVMVCDAFVGNVILKYTEGFAKSILGRIKNELMQKTSYKLGGLLAKGAFRNLKNSFDYSDQGGAPFLGLNSLVVKAHGNSDARAIKGGINQCYLAINNKLVEKLTEKLKI